MGTEAGNLAAVQAELRAIIDAALRGGLTEPVADRAIAMGPEAARAVMLAASRRIAELSRLNELRGLNERSGLPTRPAGGSTGTRTGSGASATIRTACT